jgi:hypothetical protein
MQTQKYYINNSLLQTKRNRAISLEEHDRNQTSQNRSSSAHTTSELHSAASGSVDQVSGGNIEILGSDSGDTIAVGLDVGGDAGRTGTGLFAVFFF